MMVTQDRPPPPLAAARRPVRVAHFHSSLGVYGAERWTLTLLKFLDPHQAQSLVLSLGDRPNADLFYQAARAQGLAAEHLAIAGKLNPRAVLAVRRVLRHHQIDVLHTHGFKTDILGYLATRGTAVRLVTTLHGWSADEGLRIRTYEALSRLFLRGFDRVYPLSPQLLEGLRSRGFAPEKLRLVLNAVDVESFDAVLHARAHRAATDPLHVVFVGRLIRAKGVHELLEGFGRARLAMPARLTLVGEGPERAALEALAGARSGGRNVQFTGAVAAEEIGPVLATADMLVLPSHSEGIPRVVMEALAAGVPCIGTAIPGVMQLIEHESTGLLVAVNDPAAIAQAIERLAADPALARHLATQGRRRIDERFSARRMAAEFAGQYRELLAR